MTRSTIARVLASATLAFAAAASISSCAPTTEIHASRVVIYSSIEQMIADATLAVEVKVISQSNPKDGINETPGTISQVEVVESLPIPELIADAKVTKPETGSKLSVLQYGTKDVAGVAPLLQIGKTYLLFLNPAENGDPQAFYVTGSSAGIYESTPEGLKALSVDGDKIPALLSEADLDKLAS